MRGLIALFVVLFALAPFVIAAEPTHMVLLAVQGENGTMQGSTADLFLETREGRGRVFLETFPLTKIDTQISTRFAKEIACNYFDLRCDETDFIYTIKSSSSIIGGPSAGAALAALTTTNVLGMGIDEKVAVTGTINSGGLIGPVGGLQDKIGAAADAGIKTVLIPSGSREFQNITNRTIDLVEYGKELNITVVEVTDLNDVVEHFTGVRLLAEQPELEADPDYVRIMKGLNDILCGRNEELRSELSEFTLNASDVEDIENRTTRAKEAQDEESYYSAASYCFGLNIKLRRLLYENQNLSDAKIKAKAGNLEVQIERLDDEVRERKLETITDLQTFSIVVERLNEAKVALEDIDEEGGAALLAFAEERFFSAKSWMAFFEMPGAVFVIDEEVLKASCVEKVQEAKERFQYASLFLRDLGGIESDIRLAESVGNEGEYVLCLIKASQAKAEANTILSTIGVGRENIVKIVDNKIEALEGFIPRIISKRAFPILGFSYYEYAQSLKKYDDLLALLYSEYALELSNLDIYFEEEKVVREVEEDNGVDKSQLALLGIGFLLGFGLAMLFVVISRKRTQKRRAKKPSKSRKKKR